MTHHNKLLRLYRSGLANRTWQNKAAHLRKYFSFCKQHGVSPVAPTVYDLLSFIMFLSDNLKSPGAVLNYFSSVKIWVSGSPGLHPEFDSHEIVIIKRAIIKNSDHVVSRAPPITPGELRSIIYFLSSLVPVPYVVIVALLLGFLTLMRQSNLVASTFDKIGPHVIKFSDVQLFTQKLEVTLRSSKTRSKSSPPLVFTLPAIPNSLCCPVNAWKRYVRSIVIPPAGPALLRPTGVPLTSSHLLQVLRTASLTVFGSEKGFTLHSLRRGATQACDNAGLPLPGIMQAGTWKSNAIIAYLGRTVVSDAPTALTSLLV